MDTTSPTDKVVDRRRRSFEQLAWFAPRVDQCFVFNNSSGDPSLAGVMSPAGLVKVGRLPKDFQALTTGAGLVFA
ncbi:hypothetical protein [Sphingomonas sp.]|uniref:hypothetical protein n=1 Tax=Sphingomonas sp. TaxID=28214 RepID=UPI003CC5F12D